MQPLGTKVYLLKRYSPSDSFCTFFSESDACYFYTALHNLQMLLIYGML